MTNSILKAAAAAAAIAALQGCAIFGGSGPQPAAATSAAASVDAPAYQASAAPVGLVRCKSARIDAAGCWRRGDVHVLYPSDSPGGVDASAAAYATASPASVKRK